MGFNFNQYAAEGNTFLKEYAKEMNLGKDTDRAGRIFTAIMHALRNIIPPEESLQFMAQLPMFLKGVYVSGWSTKKKRQRVKNMTEFLDLVRSYDRPAAIDDFGNGDETAERYVYTTFIYLRKYVSLGELQDIRDVLPKDLKNMIYSNIMF